MCCSQPVATLMSSFSFLIRVTDVCGRRLFFTQPHVPLFYLIKPGKHGRGARGATPASDTARRGDARGMPLPVHWCLVGPHPAMCFLLFFSTTRADSCRRGSNSHRFSLNQDDSRQIGLYRPYRIVSADDRNGRNWPK